MSDLTDCAKCEAIATTLANEAKWLDTAHKNSADKGFADQYRAGFASAAGWVRFHANRHIAGDMCTHRPPTRGDA